MRITQKILKRFNGLQFRQEYLCVNKESFKPLLNAYIISNNRVVKNVSQTHQFNGYSPLIFSFFSASSTDISFPENIEISFTHGSYRENDLLLPRVAIAALTLRKIRGIETADGFIFFYEGVHGFHRFLPRISQWSGQLDNKFFNDKKGNVFLKGNLYKQVQLAYALPRKISLITVSKEHLYNLFPTDLHGPSGHQLYIISLRHEGMACKQVENAGNIVLSDVSVACCKKAFSLGKNHMQVLKEKKEFDFTGKTSQNFNLPLPSDFVGYKELSLLSSFTHGIHKLLIFKIIWQENFITGDTLAHVHNTYATWRFKKGFESNYILR